MFIKLQIAVNKEVFRGECVGKNKSCKYKESSYSVYKLLGTQIQLIKLIGSAQHYHMCISAYNMGPLPLNWFISLELRIARNL